MIEAIVKEPEPGEIYYGKVVRLMNFGAFVNLLPGKDGMVHISKMADHRIEKVEELSRKATWFGLRSWRSTTRAV